ncbi:MAG: tetratricopeptide repeat protein [Rhizobiaceae bacterium]
MIGVMLVALVPATPAVAFDPAKIFEKEKPGSGAIFRFFFSARKKGQDQEAVGALKYAADKGDHAAQWKLGRMYQTGDGVQINHGEAFAIYRGIVDDYANAQPGSADWQFTANAMVLLGDYYLNGVPESGIARNVGEARIMFTTAATYFSHPEAQYKLARMYLEGENPQGDVIQAARMLKSAAANGHVGAEALLGQLLFDGRFLRRDPVRGLYMMLNAQRRAAGNDASWITSMQEEAFALASEDERRAAIAMTQMQQ